jgi:hypothetical protein
VRSRVTLLATVLIVGLCACGKGDNGKVCGSSPSGPSCSSPPTAVLAVKTISGTTVTFDASGSSGSRLTYTLAYDDGKTDQQSTPSFSHTFATAGNHSATLTVRDDQSHTASQTQAFAITAAPPSSIRIYGIYGGPMALANCDTTFDVLGGGGSTDDAQFYPLWNWGMDFGDGNTTTAAPVHRSGDAAYTHTYALPGQYTVTVRVGDSTGHSTSGSYSVTVATITGTWSNTYFNTGTNRSETRTLTLVQGANGAITGSYTHPEGNSDPLTGTIAGDRLVELRNQTIQYTSSHADPYGGTVSGVNGTATAITLYEIGGSADQQTLVFTKR